MKQKKYPNLEIHEVWYDDDAIERKSKVVKEGPMTKVEAYNAVKDTPLIDGGRPKYVIYNKGGTHTLSYYVDADRFKNDIISGKDNSNVDDEENYLKFKEADGYLKDYFKRWEENDKAGGPVGEFPTKDLREKWDKPRLERHKKRANPSLLDDINKTESNESKLNDDGYPIRSGTGSSGCSCSCASNPSKKSNSNLIDKTVDKDSRCNSDGYPIRK